jgi:hypothetical protein
MCAGDLQLLPVVLPTFHREVVLSLDASPSSGLRLTATWTTPIEPLSFYANTKFEIAPDMRVLRCIGQQVAEHLARARRGVSAADVVCACVALQRQRRKPIKRNGPASTVSTGDCRM